MTKSAPRKILVAVRPQDTDLVLAALGAEFDLTIVHDSVAFHQAIHQQLPSLVICGVHFDEGRMFDLLREMKSDAATAAVPFVPVLGEPSRHADGIRQGIRSAALSLGADNFVDLLDMMHHHGQQETFRKLRDLVRNAV